MISKIPLAKFGSFFHKSIISYNLDYATLARSPPTTLRISNEKNYHVQRGLFFSRIFISQIAYKSSVNFSLFTHFQPK
jgi:hypothetical protein